MMLSVPAAARIRTLAALVVLCAGVCMQVSAQSTREGVARFQSSDILRPAASQSVNPSIADVSPGALAYTVQTGLLQALRAEAAVLIEGFQLPGGTAVDLDVRSFSIFTPDAQIIEMTAQGPVRRPLPDVTLYKGGVRGVPGSWVYLAVEGAGISGTIITGDVQYSLFSETRTSFGPGASPVLTVAVTTAEMHRYGCGVSDDDVLSMFKGMPAPGTMAAAKDTLQARIAIDADLESFKHYGTVAATENYITARMGESTAIYERDVAVTLNVPFMRVWTTKDPFQGTSDKELLNVFTAFWRDSMDNISRTLAVMISRKPISAAGVSQGLAWVDQLCSTTHGYAFVKFSANNGFTDGHTGVLAHELGHNFGSPHTHSCTWNPPIDSCYTAEPINGKSPCFTSKDQHLILGGGEMMSYCHLTYGNQNHFNIFRDRTKALVRDRSDKAQCMTVTSTVRSMKVTAPTTTFDVCAGNDVTLTWDAQGVNDMSVWLSRNNGASYDTALVKVLDRNTRSWTWRVPGNFPPGTGYRLKVLDNKNNTLVDEMQVSFTVLKGVYLITQTTWRNVCVGQGARFEVVATGPGVLRYEWKKNGTIIAGAVTDTIWIQNTTANDNGSLVTCTVYSDCGSVTSDPALLKVFTNPVIIQQPNNDTVCVGGRAVLRIKADGPDLTYKWLTLGKVFNVNSPEFVIDNVKTSDANGYYCEVSSPCGKTNTYTGIVYVPTAGLDKILSPTPYQELEPGTVFDLQWKQWCMTSVKIEYSIDGGTTWNTIQGSYPADSLHYGWVVPDTETKDGVFRVSDPSKPSSFKFSPTFYIVKKPALLTSTEVNFGLVPVGSPSEKTLTVVNSGKATLSISKTEITGTAEAVVVSGAPLTLQPAQSGSIVVRVTPQNAGPLSGSLSIEHNAGGSPSLLPITGDAYNLVAVHPLPEPDGLALHQNYPNPVTVQSSPVTVMTFDLPQPQFATLSVCNVLGAVVRTVSAGMMSAGRHQITVPVHDLPAGTYVLRLVASGAMRTRVMQVLR